MSGRAARLAGALVTAAAVGVLVRLAAWQWDRGSSRGALISYVYAVEWALLAVALVAVVATRHRRRGRAPEDDSASRDAAGGVLGPPLRPGERLGDPTSVRVRKWVTGPGRLLSR